MAVDVAIVGGSYAGLSAALQLARARRSVVIIDAGLRRNRFAETSHGFLSRDGEAPSAIAESGRRQLLAYPMCASSKGRPKRRDEREPTSWFRFGTRRSEHAG